jgi:acyl dehydratase
MGLYFEEFTVDQPISTRARTVSEADIVSFAGISGDYNPLHIDEEFCKATEFGGRIAHGPLAMSMAIGLMSQLNIIDGTAMALLGLEWSFKRPVKIGDTINAVVTPTEKRRTAKPGRGVVVLRFEVRNQREETVQLGALTLLVAAKAV